MKMKVVKSWLLVSSLIVALSACGGGGSSGAAAPVANKNAQILQSSVSNVILPAVESFRSKASALDVNTSDFCAESNPVVGTLQRLQEDWKALSKAWYAVALYNFGPLDSPQDLVPRYFSIDSLRVRGEDYTNTVKANIRTSLSGSVVLDDAYFSALNFQDVGLLALEYLLFEEVLSDGEKDDADILLEYKNNTRKCGWLKGISAQLNTHANTVSQKWNVAYRDSSAAYKDLYVAGQADGVSEPFNLLITTGQKHFDYLKSRDVANQAAKFSEYAWQSIAASIDQLEALLSNSTDVSNGIFTQMNAAGLASSVTLLNGNIAEARQAITDRSDVSLNVALGKLDGNFKREIPNALGIVLGINFSDGD